MAVLMTPESAAALRAPFDPAAVGKLPRVTNRDGAKSKCQVCGGHLAPHIHLDYVGHAAVTDRLLQVDPEWQWEPLTYEESGVPLISFGGSEARMWIKLTVAGTTRLGVGIARSDSFELEKQLISDAIRNAAMRFGVALDLWSKEDLHQDEPVLRVVPVVSPTTGEVVDVANMKGREVTAALAARGLPASGSLMELRGRLQAVLSDEAAAEFVGTGASGSEATEPESVVPDGRSETVPVPDDLLAYSEAPM